MSPGASALPPASPCPLPRRLCPRSAFFAWCRSRKWGSGAESSCRRARDARTGRELEQTPPPPATTPGRWSRGHRRPPGAGRRGAACSAPGSKAPGGRRLSVPLGASRRLSGLLGASPSPILACLGSFLAPGTRPTAAGEDERRGSAQNRTFCEGEQLGENVQKERGDRMRHFVTHLRVCVCVCCACVRARELYFFRFHDS